VQNHTSGVITLAQRVFSFKTERSVHENKTNLSICQAFRIGILLSIATDNSIQQGFSMDQPTLQGICPMVVTPFDAEGRIDENSLRSVVRFELEGGIHGIAVNGFASESYKLTETERLRCAEIVSEEVNGSVPLIIGMSAGSTEAAIEEARFYETLQSSVLMVLPPYVMKTDEYLLVDYYVELGNACEIPVMVQQPLNIQGYSSTLLRTEALARIAQRCPNVLYFQIEGPGSARRIGALQGRVRQDVGLFGGAEGIGLLEELRAGATGILSGVGFNEYFVEVWAAWKANGQLEAESILGRAQELIEVVSGGGHEFSLHARKYLLQRKGIIDHVYVRRPTVRPEPRILEALGELVDTLGLRVSRPR
jgi:4-hydroxy-tetrahydrodipicolinate synthase